MAEQPDLNLIGRQLLNVVTELRGLRDEVRSLRSLRDDMGLLREEVGLLREQVRIATAAVRRVEDTLTMNVMDRLQALEAGGN